MGILGQLLSVTNRVLRPVGLSLNKLSDRNSLVLHEYRTADGSFDYEKYRAVQTKGNLEKLDHVWVKKENIYFLADYLKQTVPSPKYGICHGTRRGMEQKWFAEKLGCDVIGTEISTSATQFEKTIQWDFHDVKSEWLGSIDFIYSNTKSQQL